MPQVPDHSSMITVRELIAQLQRLEQDAIVVMPMDANSNVYSPLSHIGTNWWYSEDTEYMGLIEREQDTETIKCIVLNPRDK